MITKADTKERNEVLKELRFITRMIKNDDDVASEINDWKFVAIVIDRRLLWNLFHLPHRCNNTHLYLNVVTILIFNYANDLDNL